MTTFRFGRRVNRMPSLTISLGKGSTSFSGGAPTGKPGALVNLIGYVLFALFLVWLFWLGS